MFVVASATFRLLFVRLILARDRRKIVRFDVTLHPTAGWLSRQVTEAFPWDTAPRYLLRDGDASYGRYFRSRVKAMGIRAPAGQLLPQPVRRSSEETRYQRLSELDSGPTVLKFRLQPHSLQRINSMAILAAAEITAPMGFLVATIWAITAHKYENCGSNR